MRRAKCCTKMQTAATKKATKVANAAAAAGVKAHKGKPRKATAKKAQPKKGKPCRKCGRKK